MNIFLRHTSLVKSIRIVRTLLYVIVAVYVIFLGPVMEGDTGSYIHLDIIASPGYPSFLYAFKKIFGEEGFGIYVVFAQLLICYSSILYFVRILKKHFDLHSFSILAIEVMMLAPIYIFEYLVVNRIVSEGLAYPGFLVMIAFFLTAVFEKDKKFFWSFLIVLFALILIRAQFNFVLPVAVIMVIYLWIFEKNTKLYMPVLIFLLMMPLMISVTDKAFHYAVQGKFTSTANTGVQLTSLPFFVSDPGDYQIFDDIEVQNYFKHVYDEADRRHLLDDFYVNKFNDNVYRHFHYNFAELSFGVLSVKGREFLNPEEPGSIDAIIENNELLISMWWPLFWDNFGKSMNIFFKNCIHAFGGFYMMWLHCALLIAGLIFWFKKRSRIAFVTIFFILLSFINVLLVCLVEHSIPRFFVYQRWVLPVLLVLSLDLFFKNSFSKKLSV